MKFFSGFSRCYRRIVTTAATPRSDESSTVLTRSTNSHAPTTNSKSDWKPKLSAISEDGVVSIDERAAMKSTARSKSRSTAARGRSFSHSDYSSRKSSVAMSIPTFSATPFMF